jgi:hypothetical protein
MKELESGIDSSNNFFNNKIQTLLMILKKEDSIYLDIKRALQEIKRKEKESREKASVFKEAA